MYRGRKVSVVVPAYNEEKLLGATINSIPSFVDLIVVIDDGSIDMTPKVLEVLKEKYGDRLLVERHPVNMGVGAAIKTGYRISLEHGMDIAAVMAGDAQMNPQYLPALLDPIIDDQADYTKGNRLLSRELENMPKKRRIGNAILTVLTKFASGYWLIIDPQNGYTAANKNVMDFLVNETDFYNGYGYCNDILIKLNTYRFRVADVIMPPVYGKEKSGIKLHTYTKKLSFLLVKGFFWRIWNKYGKLHLHPILFFFAFGFILTLLGLFLGLYATYVKIFEGIDITAGTSVLVTLILVLGIQSLFFAFLFDELDSRGLQMVIHAKPLMPKELEDKKLMRDDKEKPETKSHVIVAPAGNGNIIYGVGLKDIMRKYVGPYRMHPIALMYFFGTPVLIIGIILGLYSLYCKFITNTYSIPTIVLSSLLIIIGVQSIFFGLAYEIELYKRKL